MRKKKVHVEAWLDPSLHRVLSAQKDRTGRSISSLVAEAIENHLYHTELQAEVRRAAEMMKVVSQELEKVQEALAEITVLRRTLKETNQTLQDLTKWTRVTAFWGALMVELFKARIFQTQKLSDQEFERYKNIWQVLHEIADQRIQSITGQSIWKGSFDPTKDPRS